MPIIIHSVRYYKIAVELFYKRLGGNIDEQMFSFRSFGRSYLSKTIDFFQTNLSVFIRHLSIMLSLRLIRDLQQSQVISEVSRQLELDQNTIQGSLLICWQPGTRECGSIYIVGAICDLIKLTIFLSSFDELLRRN